MSVANTHIELFGVECGRCSFRSVSQYPNCPDCGGPLTDTVFSGTGAVWASTVVHIAVGGRTPPYGLAYVDIDSGPRLLCRTELAEPLQPGARVHVIDLDDDGIATVGQIP